MTRTEQAARIRAEAPNGWAHGAIYCNGEIDVFDWPDNDPQWQEDYILACWDMTPTLEFFVLRDNVLTFIKRKPS